MAQRVRHRAPEGLPEHAREAAAKDFTDADPSSGLGVADAGKKPAAGLGESWKDDELGTVNFITPEKVRAAAALGRTGKVISLAIPFDKNGLQTGTPAGSIRSTA